MKKHLFALGAASVMALGAMSGSVFATDVTGESGTADAVYSVGKSYIINIPGKITLAKSGNSATYTANVSASKVLLGVGETLTVSVRTSTGKLQASSGAVTSEIPYTIAINGGSAVNATTLAGDDKYSEIFTMAAGTTTQANTPLALTTTSFDGVKLAAEHKDTLTFKVSVDIAKTMQNIAAIKGSMNIGDQIQLADQEDNNKLYWVGKLADGNVWMTQNLDNQAKASTVGANVYYANGTASTGTTLEGVAADSELRHYAGGSYYNWFAAKTACPQGWALPTKDQFDNLISAANLTKDNISSNPFYGVHGGNVNGMGEVMPGGYGFYWTASELGGDGYYLIFSSSALDVWKTDNTSEPRSVRCVAE